MSCTARRILGGMVLALTMVGSLRAEPTEALRVATFQCDVTPPIGHWLYRHPLKTIEHPLLAKGIVLEQDNQRYVLCAIDWCVLSGGAHALLRQKMAAGAATAPANTALQCVHVHSAPIIDAEAKGLLAGVEDAPEYYDPGFLKRVADGLKKAVQDAVSRLAPCDRIGISQAKVDRVASDRRIMVDGRSAGEAVRADGIRLWPSCRKAQLIRS